MYCRKKKNERYGLEPCPNVKTRSHEGGYHEGGGRGNMDEWGTYDIITALNLFGKKWGGKKGVWGVFWKGARAGGSFLFEKGFVLEHTIKENEWESSTREIPIRWLKGKTM